MNFKTKVLGMLAGSALTLSVATGAIAQTESTATVTLAEKQDAQGGTLASVYFPNLEATWDGTTYALPPGLRQVVLELGFDAAAPADSGTRNVSVWGTDFEGKPTAIRPSVSAGWSSTVCPSRATPPLPPRS